MPSMTRIYVPADSAALALDADALSAAIVAEAGRRGAPVEIVRNGSHGMHWLEPLVEVQTTTGRVGYGPVTVAAGFSIDFLQPGRLGQVLHADAREVSRRGRSGIYDVTVRADDPEAGDVIAEFRGRSRTLPDRGSASRG